FSSRRRHTRFSRDWSSDVCSSDLNLGEVLVIRSRDIVTGEEIFGEGFGAFQLCRAFAWAKNLQTRGFKLIHDTADQRRFGADDRSEERRVGKECRSRWVREE